tara:strand:- start:409 stop:618 length:210 start_codon:yes stop_codon:yes gene_type:complete
MDLNRFDKNILLNKTIKYIDKKRRMEYKNKIGFKSNPLKSLFNASKSKLDTIDSIIGLKIFTFNILFIL